MVYSNGNTGATASTLTAHKITRTVCSGQIFAIAKHLAHNKISFAMIKAQS